MKPTLIAALCALGFSTPALAQDAEAGERGFNQCRACHSITDEDGNYIFRGGVTGPNLYGLPGRVAGTDPDFARYRDDIKAAGEAGLVWDEEHFVSYVQDPNSFLRDYLDDSSARSGMANRVRDEETARDIWAYLVSVSPEVEMADDAEASDG